MGKKIVRISEPSKIEFIEKRSEFIGFSTFVKNEEEALEIIKQKTGFSPILLLDDVLAELDETRQNYLLKSIDKDIQTIITSVDTLLFEDEFLKDVQIYLVENGNIKTNL